MSENRFKAACLKRILYTSSWLPLFFLAVFGVFILSQFYPLPKFIRLNTTVLMLNMVCFLALIVTRFVWYFKRRADPVRYDFGDRPQKPGDVLNISAEALREKLTAEGYQFADNGYAENSKRTSTAMILLYGGLLVALLVGTYENVYNVSAALFQGVGNAIPMSDRESYLYVNKGPLGSIAGLPGLKIKQQILPSKEWPKGAVDMELVDAKDKVLARTILERGAKPFVYNGFEYHFNRFLFDAVVEIVASNKNGEFNDSMKLQPLDKPEGAYSYYANFKGERMLWTALLDPSRMAIKLRGFDKNKQQQEGELVFRRDPLVKFGNFEAKVTAMGHWSEIHVVRVRHMYLVYISAAVALIGLLMRIMFRPKRLWMEELAEGCRVVRG